VEVPGSTKVFLPVERSVESFPEFVLAHGNKTSNHSCGTCGVMSQERTNSRIAEKKPMKKASARSFGIRRIDSASNRSTSRLSSSYAIAITSTLLQPLSSWEEPVAESLCPLDKPAKRVEAPPVPP